MTIENMLNEAGLPPKECGRLLNDIRVHNEQHPEHPIQAFSLQDTIDQVTIPHMPFIGRAIARVRGDYFLDSEENFPLTIDDNALRYAAYKLDRFYRRGKKSAAESN